MGASGKEVKLHFSFNVIWKVAACKPLIFNLIVEAIFATDQSSFHCNSLTRTPVES